MKFMLSFPNPKCSRLRLNFKMSDSDSDGLLTNNVYPFQTKSTLVQLKGPNTNLSNITGISFQNHILSSTMQPQPYRRNYAESNYDQRSMSYRREISPVGSDMGPINRDYSFNFRMLGAPRSVYNGRTSPTSMRSTGTSASFGAGDVVNALNNRHFNREEIKTIKATINKLCRPKVRKRIDKHRYGKRYRRKISGHDSGEQASDSSISSDDRSVRTDNRDNMSSCRSIASTSYMKRKIHESNLLKDCSSYIKQSFSRYVGPGTVNTTQTSISSQRSMPSFNMPTFKPLPVSYNISQVQPTAPVMLQKERFTNGYLLPSQRFNRSAIPSIPENAEREHKETNSHNKVLARNRNLAQNIDTDSDEDIFTNVSQQKKVDAKRKRSIDDDVFVSNHKRRKTLSPCHDEVETQKEKANKVKPNDFVFAKPACPARKSVKEKLISKSAALLDTVPQEPTMPKSLHEKHAVEKEKDEHEQSNSTCNSTNVSMRPSFIKRKLYTPSVIDNEKLNSSVESLNSPQNSIYGGILREKNKARKLQKATTQSYLTRDIQKDNGSLLDLISKIVPLDQMNMTSQSNKTGSQSKNLTEDDDKWDVTSIISTKNDDNLSNTYTDEEILDSTVKELRKEEVSKEQKKEKEDKKSTPKKPSPVKVKNCRVLLEKVPKNVENFWETDIESDAEFMPSPRIDKLLSKENHRPVMQPKEAPRAHYSNMINSNKPASIPSSKNYTFDTTQSFNNTLRIRSHKAPKRNIQDRTTNENTKMIVLGFENKQKQIQTSSSSKISTAKSVPTKIDSTPKITSKIKDKKSPIRKKEASKQTNKQNQSVQKPSSKKQEKAKKEIILKTPEKVSTSKKRDLEKNTPKKIEKPKASNKSPKTKTSKKKKEKNNSPITKENNNTSRVIRSCRANSKNRTADKSFDLNDMPTRTLRSGQLNLSSTANNKKSSQNISNVLFSVALENIHKKRFTRIAKTVTNAEESDVSFSLSKDSSLPKRMLTRNASKNNSVSSTPVKKNPPRIRELPGSNVKPRNMRTPNQKYMRKYN